MALQIQRGERLYAQAKLVTEQCCSCSMVFAMPAEFKARALAKRGPSGQVFFCPAGHRQWYLGETAEAKLRRENDRLKQNEAYLEQQRQRAADDAEHQRRRANGYKGHAAKITKRAKAGLCPCCNRTFSQLARHMATQHPDFTPDVPEPARAGAPH